jgi:hypothetical protein
MIRCRSVGPVARVVCCRFCGRHRYGALAQLAAFRRTQRMVSRRSYLDSVSTAYISRRRNTFPRVGRQSLANRLETRHWNAYTLPLESMAWRDWTRAVFRLSADRLKAWRGDPTGGDPQVTLEARLILAADIKLRTSWCHRPVPGERGGEDRRGHRV